MKHKTVIFLGISLVILAIMLWFVGIDKVIDALKLANPYYILLSVILQLFIIVLYGLRWNLINKIANIHCSLKSIIPMTLVGLGVNNITPAGRGGGEPVRAYILSRDKDYPMEETFATVVADRALDTFPFVVLAIITLIAMTFHFDVDVWLMILMIIGVIAIVAFLGVIVYMCINEAFGLKVQNWVIKLVRRFYKKDTVELESKIKETIAGFQKTMRLLLSKKDIFFYALPVSFLIWIFEIIRVYLVFVAFGSFVNPMIIGEVFILASLVGMIPVLPGGLGAVDSVMIIFYASAGISASISAGATVIERLISYWLVTILGLCILPYYGSSVLDKVSFSPKASETVDEIAGEFEDIGEDDKVFDENYSRTDSNINRELEESTKKD